jgi:hypothetical protein
MYSLFRLSKKSTSYYQEIVELPPNFHTALTKVIAKMLSMEVKLEYKDKSLPAGRQARSEKTECSAGNAL